MSGESDHLRNGDQNKDHPERKLSRVGESLYTALDIPKGSDPQAVKKAYRKLALRYHPDKNPNDEFAADKFKEINRANTILSNPEKKALYDSHGSFGLYLADQMGDEGVRLYSMFNSPLTRCIALFCCLFTGCCCCLCCCCCCNCCCGKCKPKKEEEEPMEQCEMDHVNEEEDDPPVSNIAYSGPVHVQPKASDLPPEYVISREA